MCNRRLASCVSIFTITNPLTNGTAHGKFQSQFHSNNSKQCYTLNFQMDEKLPGHEMAKQREAFGRYFIFLCDLLAMRHLALERISSRTGEQFTLVKKIGFLNKSL